MKQPSIDTGNIAIVGAGRAGSSLALALTAAGYPVTLLIDTQAARARRWAAVCGCRSGASVRQLDASIGLLFLAVPDDAIAPLARRIAGQGAVGPKTSSVHLSGLHPAALLNPLGGSRASFHPCIPLLEGQAEAFRGAAVALEGDAAVLPLLKAVAVDLGARPVILSPEQKILYHAACTAASNFINVTLFAAARLLQASGSHEGLSLLMPLVRKTIDNIEMNGPVQSLTGPALRGDSSTVRAHLEAISAHVPAIKDLYTVLSLSAAEIALEAGADPAGIEKVRNVLRR